MGEFGGIWQHPGTFIAALVAGAAVLSFALILALYPVLRRYALARPNARSSHREATPQGAGIAVVAAAAAAGTAFAMLIPAIGAVMLIPVLGAAAGLAILGAIDDIRTLEAWPRLAVQSVAVLVVLAFLPAQIHIFPPVPLWIERALLFVALLWFVNLVNFMDGIDWMTVAEVVPVTAALALFGLLGALPAAATVAALALCGAMLGFAPLNRPVARVFLGDVGSLPVGLLLGWLLVVLADRYLAAALLLPLYYLADATLTLLRRYVRGERVTQAHRSHFYQRALTGGLSVPAIVGRVFAVNLALIALAAATLIVPSWPVHLAAVIAGGALVGWLLYRFERAAG